MSTFCEDEDTEDWKKNSDYNFDPDAWKKGSEYDSSNIKVKSVITELGRGLRPKNIYIIDQTLNCSVIWSLPSQEEMLTLNKVKDGLIIHLLDTEENWQFSKSRNLWISVQIE